MSIVVAIVLTLLILTLAPLALWVFGDVFGAAFDGTIDIIVDAIGLWRWVRRRAGTIYAKARGRTGEVGIIG